MNNGILKTLIKKDWRVYRTPVAASVILGVVPYVMCLAALAIDRSEPYSRMAVPATFIIGAYYALVLTALMGAVFGGVAFAGERRERSADFLNLLPPRRSQLVLSKLLVTTQIILSCALVHMVILVASYLIRASDSPIDAPGRLLILIVCAWIGATLMFFGVAWMLSTFLSSASISACVAIATVAMVGAFIGLLSSELQLQDTTEALLWGMAVLLLGPGCWGAGTVYYLWRVEP